LSIERADFLIIGSGIAGMRAAIGLASAGRVLILTKAEPTESNTGHAQGGIAAAIGDDDSPDLHVADTLRAGDGLCDEAAVRVLVEEGVTYVKQLTEWGTKFDLGPDGRPALGREAAHSVRRVLHAGDATGREIGRTLWGRVRSMPGVTTTNHALVTEVIVEGGVARGVRYFDPAGRLVEARAESTLLATGGAGQIFSENTNPPVATGDGVALAYHAGARLADLEFVQFHPTALKRPNAPRFLISEALRGEGARLVNQRGDAFMTRYHESGDLAPRDVVARSIMHEVDRVGGDVFLTLGHLDPAYVYRRFPTIAEMVRRAGLDLARDPIPVGPAAHYMMGGIDTDIWTRTSLAGLFAAGEVACTGVHGANRLASNSLLEGLVFGARAALSMQQAPAAALLKSNRVEAAHFAAQTLPASGPPSILDTAGVRDLMWRSAGLFRSRGGLQQAVQRLESAYAAARTPVEAGSPDGDDWRNLNLVTAAKLVARAALRREESRGGHFREDFPRRDDAHWRVHVVDCRGDEPEPGSTPRRP
jgi:L-aspartate oxidase